MMQRNNVTALSSTDLKWKIAALLRGQFQPTATHRQELLSPRARDMHSSRGRILGTADVNKCHMTDQLWKSSKHIQFVQEATEEFLFKSVFTLKKKFNIRTFLICTIYQLFYYYFFYCNIINYYTFLISTILIYIIYQLFYYYYCNIINCYLPVLVFQYYKD